MNKKYALIGIVIIIFILFASLIYYTLSDQKKNTFSVTVINLTDERLVIFLEFLDNFEEGREFDRSHTWLSTNESATFNFEYDKSASMDTLTIYAHNQTYYEVERFEDDDFYLRWNGLAEYNISEKGIQDLYALITPAPSDLNLSNLPYPKYFIGNTSLIPVDITIIRRDDELVNKVLDFS